MEPQPCPNCGVSVVPMKDRICPSCRSVSFAADATAPPSTETDRRPRTDHVGPSASPEQSTLEQTKPQGSAAQRAAIFSAMWPAVLMFVLLVVAPCLGAHTVFYCCVPIGTFAALGLGVFACIGGTDRREGLAVALGIFGIIWSVCILGTWVWFGILAQQAQQQQFRRMLER